MFNLSPKEHLLLLATKTNHPEASWQQLSELIFSKHGCYIPSQVCRDHYKYITSTHQLNTSLQSIPEDFVFTYKQVREKTSNKKSIALSSLERYEKIIVAKMLGIKTPKTQPICKSHDKSIDDHQQLVNQLYLKIRQRSDPSGVLTPAIAQQKLELFLSEIVQEINQHPNCRIEDGLKIIRQMQKDSLFESRKKIFESYFEAGEVNEYNSKIISSFFAEVILSKNSTTPTQLSEKIPFSAETSSNSDQEQTQKQFNQDSKRDQNDREGAGLDIKEFFNKTNEEQEVKFEENQQEHKKQTACQVNSEPQQQKISSCNFGITVIGESVTMTASKNNQKGDTKEKEIKIEENEVKVQEIETDLAQQTSSRQEEDSRTKGVNSKKKHHMKRKVWLVLQ